MTQYYDGSCSFAYTDGKSYKVTWTVGITDDPEETRKITLKRSRICHLELTVNENTKAVFDKGRWIRRPLFFSLNEEDSITRMFVRHLSHELYRY